MKCGSTLEPKSAAINIYPPRMPKWKKPLRDIMRSMRKSKVAPQINDKSFFSHRLKEFFSDSISGLLLSIVPGLAHGLQHRFKEIRWYFLAWLILLLSGLFLYGSAVGYICLGLAIGVHAAIALQYGILKDLSKISEKVVMIILVLIGLTLLYRLIPRIPLLNLTGAHSSLTIPYHNVEAGDYLLARGGLNAEGLLPRGSLVLIHPITLRNQSRIVTRSNDTTIGEIIGLPNENIRILNDVFIIDGLKLDIKRYPVPRWLRKVPFSTTIPVNTYFVSVQYSVRAHGMRLGASHIKQICLINAGDIEAKVFMRWWPLLKRGFID